MSEPFFPPPQKKKEPAPYRAAAAMPARRIDDAPPTRKAPPPVVDDAPDKESFVATFARRFAIRVGALAIAGGFFYGLARAHEAGEKWPQAVILVLGALGILLSPVVLFVRLRRLVRFLFARGDDA